MNSKYLPWLVVAAAFVVNALAGVTRNLLAVVIPAMQAELGWSRSVIASGATVALVVMGAAGLYAGITLNRHGRANMLCAGLGLMGIGFIGTGFAQSPLAYLAAFGICVGLGLGLTATNVVSTTIAPYFTDRRGFALGVSQAGLTAGPVIAIPLAVWAASALDWRTMFFIFGALSIAFVPIVYAVIGKAGQPAHAGAGAPARLRDDLRFLVRSPTFHLLFWGFAVCGFTTTGVIETHFLPYAATCGFAPLAAANAISVLSFFNMVGIILIGGLSDRFSGARILAVIYAVRAASFVFLLTSDNDLTRLYLFAVIFGFVDYGTAPVIAAVAASHFGLRRMGFALGLIGLAHQIGAAAGAFGGGWVFDLYNSYAGLWVLSIALAAVAALMSIAIPKRPALA